MSNLEAKPQAQTRRPSKKVATTTFSTEVIYTDDISSSPLSPLLRLADEIESKHPRVAYLCRHYVFTIVSKESFIGHDVWHLKTLLQRRLERDDATSLAARVNPSDGAELEGFYNLYIKQKADSEHMSTVYQTGKLLLKVFRALVGQRWFELDDALPAFFTSHYHAPYNILPFSHGCQFEYKPEIQVIVYALMDTVPLNWRKSVDLWIVGHMDLLGDVRAVFGFQLDNAENQREHLILLLASARLRMYPKKFLTKFDDCVVDAVMNNLFINYKKWCNFLGQEHRLLFPEGGKVSIIQRKLVYMSLYLLIWGEASNLRFMPECLCYIFHHMAYELNDLLVDGVLCFLYGHGGDDKRFLRKVITPIYRIIEKEAEKSRDGRAPHSAWCNYDDLNEYFWSPDCFSLGWPIPNNDHIFKSTFNSTLGRKGAQRTAGRTGKSNFVETRSFWHIFRSFDRLWTFYVLCLQIMLIIAWEGISVVEIFKKDALYKLTSIFITAAFLRLLLSISNLRLNFPAYHHWRLTDVLRDILKVVVSLFWAIALPLFYVHSFRGAPEFIKEVLSFLHQMKGIPPLYLPAVAVYLLPNLLAAALFLFPMLRRWIENSDWHIVRLLLWWSQLRIFVGRGMPESQFGLIKHTLFWVILLVVKFSFSYLVQIKPLVQPTKDIMSIHHVDFAWHKIFPKAQHNYGAVFALWAPIILVYFMDTQIWYSIFSAVYGVRIGIFNRLGEILITRFQSLPDAFNRYLIPTERKIRTRHEFYVLYHKFSRIWNEIIFSFREEDIISDRERDLLLVPHSSDPSLIIVQWPPFLLASKIPVALEMAAQFTGKDSDLWMRICADEYMKYAVIELFKLFKHILTALVSGAERRAISAIIREVESSIFKNTLLTSFRLGCLPSLCKKFAELVEILKDADSSKQDAVGVLLADMLEVFTREMMVNEISELAELIHCSKDSGRKLFSDAKPAVLFPPVVAAQWFEEKIRRLHLLLTVKESAIEVPTNLEARRRIAFFTNSLFMDMPRAPAVRQMFSFSVLTQYDNEETVYSKNDLKVENEDGLSIMHYLKKIYSDEWNNFKERLHCKKDRQILKNDEHELQLRSWASLRGQTLCRTVRGMMYYHRALKLLASVDMLDGVSYKNLKFHLLEDEFPEVATGEVLLDIKITYVLTCQNYGNQKRSGDRHATDILALMVNNPSLRVAYIDEAEEIENGNIQKAYYSVLVKAVDNREREIYRIKLPGPAKLGEGKLENQNHAIIFTRGETLKIIDMNQDNYFEEALKMRILLEEFNEDHGVLRPTTLGVREQLFNGRVRLNYGHPDVFDRIFHLTRGGISKSSCGINLSADIFAGFNSTLRCGNMTHHEYIQVGKGVDVGFNQISLLEAKVACGNGEQTMSRDVYRLGHCLDFFPMLSFYYTTIGCYISSMIMVLMAYAFLYGKLCMSLSGFEAAIVKLARRKGDDILKAAMGSQYFVQIGILTTLPIVLEIVLERGFLTGLGDLIIMQLRLAPMLFTFLLGTKVHFFGRTLLHGGVKYNRATGHGFVLRHEKFTESYRLYSRSHFVKGIELLILLICYEMFGSATPDSTTTFALWLMWFLVCSWLFSPFIFNPSGFEWQKIVDDWDDWTKWISSRGGFGVPSNKSWESWWDEEQEHLHHTGLFGRICEVILTLRLFVYQYGIVYHLHVARGDKSIMVYALSWVVIVAVMVILKIVSMGREEFNTDFQLMFRLLVLFLFIGASVAMGLMITLLSLTMGDIFVSLLAFLPTAWALILIAQACRPLVKGVGLWGSVKALARGYEYIMGVVIFAPVAILAWFPFISEFQTRLLFDHRPTGQLFDQAWVKAAVEMWGSLKDLARSVDEWVAFYLYGNRKCTTKSNNGPRLQHAKGKKNR